MDILLPTQNFAQNKIYGAVERDRRTHWYFELLFDSDKEHDTDV